MTYRFRAVARAFWVSGLFSVGLALVACEDADTTNHHYTAGGNDGQGNTGSTVMGGAAAQGGNPSSTDDNAGSGPGGVASRAGASSITNGRRHCKRGVAYGQHTDADMTVLSPKVVWWYNWHYAPDSSLTSAVFEQLDVEYVPMVWGPAVNLNDVETKMPNSATTLLGYNEPNFYAQANVSAADTAQKWPPIQALADKKGLRLISPAVNYCGGGCHDTDPFSYLKGFFQACPDCRVDAIAVHIYVGCQISSGNHAQWLIDHLERYQAEFPQPIWLTEFACDDARNEGQQQAFLEDAVTYLEATPRIERYAWFASRADNVPYVNLLNESGTLTELGQAYLNAPVNADCRP